MTPQERAREHAETIGKLCDLIKREAARAAGDEATWSEVEGLAYAHTEILNVAARFFGDGSANVERYQALVAAGVIAP
jgi:hypothetical protein